MSTPEVGAVVVHRRYVSHADAHYGGALVDGAFSLALFGDVATELCIRTDGDEGLFAGYSDVCFHEAVRAGDVLEVSAELVKVGRRSRDVAFEARVVCRAQPDVSASASQVLDPPLVVTSARGTVVVPSHGGGPSPDEATTVVWVTCGELPDGDPDDHLALPAMASAGLAVRYLPWDHPTAWCDPDVLSGLVVVRSTWDYTLRREEFLAWARTVPTLANPAEVLAWNTDKVYLDELVEAGLPVVPTRTVRPDADATDAAAAAVAEAFATAATVVVKPTVSAGSKDTRRHGDPAGALAHTRQLLEAGRPVLVQPYLDGVDTLGETGMVVVDGQVSHAFRKGQLLQRDAAATDGLYAEEDIAATTATAEQLEVARAVTDFLLHRFPEHAPLLYARVDTVPGPDGHPLLLELELAEPSLWLVADPGAGAEWAQAQLRRLRTLTG